MLMAMANSYETHITIDSSESRSVQRLAQFVESRNMKWTQILLNSGQVPDQPMITFWGIGTLQIQLDRARSVCRELEDLECSVVRLKVEKQLYELDEANFQSMDTSLIPEPTLYFEHHLKLLLESEANLVELQKTIQPFDGRLSRNARRCRDDGLLERFVTQRAYKTSAKESLDSVARLKRSLEDADFEIIDTESECVLFDSNIDLDADWL